jgi:DeoR/GlpR family transcriptional regulator of sugar metabolism
MVYFSKPKKKYSFDERVRQIRELLNKRGEVSVEDLILELNLSPIYAKTLLTYASKKIDYAELNGDVLVIKEKKIEKEKEEGEVKNE